MPRRPRARAVEGPQPRVDLGRARRQARRESRRGSRRVGETRDERHEPAPLQHDQHDRHADAGERERDTSGSVAMPASRRIMKSATPTTTKAICAIGERRLREDHRRRALGERNPKRCSTKAFTGSPPR
jgi:hypothetical protein